MNYDNIAFSIGGLNVYWYALFLAVGIIAAVIVVDIEAKRRKLYKDLALDLCIVSLPCGLLGARFFACLFEGRFSDFFSSDYSGMMLFGALIAAGIGIAVYSKIRKFSVLESLDCVTLGMLTAIAIARWGDLFQRVGCGPFVKASWLKWIPISMLNNNNEVCLSVFFLEFIACVGIFLLLRLFISRIKTEKGTEFFAGTALYCFIVFFLEFLRQDRPVLWILKTNQWFCLVIIIAIIAYLIITKKMRTTISSLIKPQSEMSANAEDIQPLVEQDTADTADDEQDTADTADDEQDTADDDAQPSEDEQDE